MEQPAIVLGCHRSGTTLLAQILHDSGIDMGIWRRNHEDELMTNYCIMAAAAAHIQPDYPEHAPEILADKDLFDAEVRFLSELMSGDVFPDRPHCDDGPWGWKHPISTLLWPVFDEYFDAAKFVYIQRDGRDVANSMWQRTKRHWASTDVVALAKHGVPYGISNGVRCKTFKGCYELWEDYVKVYEALKAMWPNATIHEITYEDLVQDHEAVVAGLGEFLGCRIYPASDVRSDRVGAWRKEVMSNA